MGVLKRTHEGGMSSRNSSRGVQVKRVGKHVRHPKATIKSLPNDLLLTQVLARVSSSSSTDLFNIKLRLPSFLIN